MPDKVDEKKNLSLESLTNAFLPSVADREPELPSTEVLEPEPPATFVEEPSPPAERPNFDVRGREPDEVLPETEQSRVAPSSNRGVTKYKIRVFEGDHDRVGKLVELTAQELEQRGLLSGMVQSAQQLPGLSRKYNELLEEARSKSEVEPQPPKAEPAVDPQQQWLQVKQTLAPRVEQAIAIDIKNGEIEADLAEVYPLATRTLYSKIILLDGLLTEARTALAVMIRDQKVQAQKSHAAELFNSVSTTLLDLSAKGGFFKPLADPQAREDFIEWLMEMNPMESQVTGDKAADFLERQWIARNKEAVIEPAPPPKEKPADKRFVRGEGAGSRPGTGTKPQEKTLLDNLIDPFLPAA